MPSIIWSTITFPSYPNELGATYKLTESTVTIGRSSKNDIHLDRQITTSSKNHCTLTFDSQSNVCSIIDTSTNGTWVNHVRLVKGKSTQIKHKDLIIVARDINGIDIENYFVFEKSCNLFVSLSGLGW